MDLEKMSLAELKNLAKEKGLKGCSTLKKQELIDRLNEAGTSQKAKAAPAVKTEAPAVKAEAPAVKAETPEVKAPAAKRTVKTDTAGHAPAVKAEAPAVKAEAPAAQPSRPAAPQGTRPENGSGRPAPVQGRPQDSRGQAGYDRQQGDRPSQGRPPQQRAYSSDRPQNYSSDRPQNYSSDRPQNYSSDRPRNYSSDRPQNYSSDRPQNYSSDRPQNYSSDRPQNYSSDRPQSYSSDRPQNYSSDRPQGYSSDRPQSYSPERPQNPNTERPQGSPESARPMPAQTRPADIPEQPVGADLEPLDSGETKSGILEVLPDGYAFIRCDNFLPGENDVYVSPAQVRKFNLKTGDIVVGNTKVKTATEKFSALLYIKSVNGFPPAEAVKRPRFEDLTPVFPNERLHLETPGCSPAMRIVDLISPIGKGQRGMIVSQPKAGKTTLLKQIAKAILYNHPEMHMIILLIDERPEEVTDMKESIQGPNVEVIYSTFDELPDNHKRVSEMVIERARRLVEHKQDVIILLDSITRLARAYNLTCTASGRTLSGGLDPAALYMPKKFFGAARNMREGGSLTVLATALVDTGSRMDDVVFEEFKGTGNMELVLDRNLSEKRIFPAIDLPKSGTRRDDLLLSPAETDVNFILRRAFNSARPEDAVERIINLFAHTRSNAEFIEVARKTKF